MTARHGAWRLLASWDPGWGRAQCALERHRATCLRCQAVVARRRAVGRRLAALRGEVSPAPAGLVVAVLEDIARPAQRSAPGSRRVLAATTAAVAVAVAVVGWSRLRHA